MVTSIYLHFNTESPRNHEPGMFSLDMKGVHVERCVQYMCMKDKDTETQIDGRRKRERQTERDGGGERGREMREEGTTIKGGGKG